MIKEYLKLIPKGIKNADKVIEGLINETKSLYDGLTEEQHNEIVRRRLICQSCPFYSENAKTSQEYFDIFGKNYESDRPDFHCSVCACNEKLKTSSLSSDCGLDTDEKTKHIPLKWEAFKQNKTK